MLSELIGYQVLEILEDSILLKKENKEIKLEINSSHGSCCGYSSFNVLMYEKNSHKNPIITNVEFIKGESPYYGVTGKLTFYGENKEIAEINAEAGSESGYYYGAIVQLECKKINKQLILAEY